MSQKNIRKALVESDTLVMNKISAEMIALMITPASRSVWTGTRPSDTTTRYMVTIVAPAPRNANRWSAEKPANAQPIPICNARTAITRLHRVTVSAGSGSAPVWTSAWDGVVIELLHLRSQGTAQDGGSAPSAPSHRPPAGLGD